MKNLLSFSKLWFIPFSSLLFFWFYKTENIGLHLDETFFALKALGENPYYLFKNPLHGINNYSGILTIPFIKLSFHFFGVGLLQLRLGALLFNSIFLFTILYFLNRTKIKGLSFFLFLFLAQFSFFLLFPKISWELTQFGFLFFAIVSLLVFEFYNCTKNQKLFAILLIISSLLGTYNHALFLSFLVALFLGFSLFQFNKSQFHSVLLVLGFCLLNSVLFFVINVFIYNGLNLITSSVLLVLIFLEIVFFEFWNQASKLLFYSLEILFKKLEFLLKPFLIFVCLAFFYLYGELIFEVFTEDKLFLRILASPLEQPEKSILMVVGAIQFILLLIFVFGSIFRKTLSLDVFVLCSYFLILLINYKGVSSFRHQIYTLLILCCFLAYRVLKKQNFLSKLFVLLSVFHFSFTQITLHNKLTYPGKIVGKEFIVGGKQDENSFHFLPFDPVVEFARKNNVGFVKSKDLFIPLNFQFYTFVYPELKSNPNTAIVDFDEKSKNGFSMILE